LSFALLLSLSLCSSPLLFYFHSIQFYFFSCNNFSLRLSPIHNFFPLISICMSMCVCVFLCSRSHSRFNFIYCLFQIRVKEKYAIQEIHLSSFFSSFMYFLNIYFSSIITENKIILQLTNDAEILFSS